MRYQSIFAVTIASLVFSTTILGQTRTLNGAGATPCRDVLAKSTYIDQAGQWVAGYLSALSPLEDNDFASKLSSMSVNSQVRPFIIKQCESSPSTTISELAFVIYKQFGGKYFN